MILYTAAVLRPISDREVPSVLLYRSDRRRAKKLQHGIWELQTLQMCLLHLSLLHHAKQVGLRVVYPVARSCEVFSICE
jgi:hypothetical protein